MTKHFVLFVQLRGAGKVIDLVSIFQDYGWLVDEGLGDSDALLLTAGELRLSIYWPEFSTTIKKILAHGFKNGWNMVIFRRQTTA